MAKPPGRKPKPTKFKLLAGNPGRRPLNEKEPKPDPAKLRCPSWLKGEGRLEWKRKVKELEALGLLTKLDRAHLEMYCSSYGRLIELEKVFAKREISALLQLTKAGNIVMNMLYCCLNREKEMVHKFATEFGMTPSSRSRISAEPQPKKSEFAKFLNAKKQ